MAGVTLYLLAKNPEAQAKLQEEVDKVLGDGTGPLTQRHLDQLSYLKAVVKEATRYVRWGNRRDNSHLVKTSSNDPTCK